MLTNTDLWALAVINHGVDEALVAAVFEENRKFFALPTAQKELIIADSNNRRGRFLADRHTTRDVVCLLLIRFPYLPAGTQARASALPSAFQPGLCLNNN